MKIVVSPGKCTSTYNIQRKIMNHPTTLEIFDVSRFLNFTVILLGHESPGSIPMVISYGRNKSSNSREIRSQ
jgi:hypothetical protein